MMMDIRLRFRDSFVKQLIVIAGFCLVIVLSAFVANQVFAQSDNVKTVSEEHVINVFDRGEHKVFVTRATTVREALKAADISLNEGQDVVEPALDSELVASKYNINIYRAKPVTIVDGTLRQRIVTASQTPEQIAKAANLELYPEDIVQESGMPDVLVDGADLVLSIDRATPVNLMLYGKPVLVRTHAQTVGELLEEREIKLSADDTISLEANSAIVADITLEIWRNGKQTVTLEEEIDFPVEKIQDADRPIGFREIRTAGEKGMRSVTYEIERKNDQEVRRTEINAIIVDEPKKQVEVVGVKSTGGLTKSMGVKQFTDSNGVTHRETYYDLPMGVVMGNCGAGGYYTVREDGVKVDASGYVIVAANLGNYPRCSVVETSLGLAKVYDTGGFANKHPHGIDIATDWTNNNGR